MCYMGWNDLQPDQMERTGVVGSPSRGRAGAGSRWGCRAGPERGGLLVAYGGTTLECARSHQILEVKLGRAPLVQGWEAARQVRLLEGAFCQALGDQPTS